VSPEKKEFFMRADRLIAIMLRLQAQGKMTTYALAEELEVSRRTILRDIEAISSAGIPIYTDAGHHGGVTLDENYRLKLTGLKENEVRALILSGNEKVLDDIGLGQAAKTTVLKLFASLPSLHQEAAKEIQQRIYIDPVWWWHGQQSLDFINMLYEAVNQNKRIQVRYERRDGSVADYAIEPYGLVAKASMWYLVAAREGELRTYRVSRFLELRVLDGHFTRPSDFDLLDYWEQNARAFIDTILQFSCQLRIQKRSLNFTRWYAASRWEIIEENEEEFVGDFEFESKETAMMLIFGLGADVEILEPKELENAVREQARLFS
jgi:predicted DNA-binding transcriptional regulator YafY